MIFIKCEECFLLLQCLEFGNKFGTWLAFINHNKINKLSIALAGIINNEKKQIIEYDKKYIIYIFYEKIISENMII